MASFLGQDYVFNDLRERFFAPFGVEHASSLRYVSNFLFEPNSTLFVIAFFFTHKIIASLNLYYLATFPLAFIAAYWVGGRLRLSDPFRFGCAALYALMPYHFQHGEGHLMESSYFLVPLLIYIILTVFRRRPLFHIYTDGKWRLSFRQKQDWGFFAVAFFSSLNEYHQFFFAILLGCAALASASRNRNMRVLLGVTILFVAIGISVVGREHVNGLLAEPGLSLSQIGAPISSYGQEERYGFKMTQLLLPVNGHHLAWLQNIVKTYNSAHLVNENATVAIGSFGAIGFAYLIICGAYAIIVCRRKLRILDLCALLTLICVLIGTVGGLSSVIATLGLMWLGPASAITQIRGYDRIVVFIGFFSYYACSVLLEQFSLRVARRVRARLPREVTCSMIGLPIFALAIWDQDPFRMENPKGEVIRQMSDQVFFSQIEASLPPRSMIFQYPFNLHHSDVNESNRAGYTYSDGIRPYLNSRRLRFTYGGDSGSIQLDWLEETSELPPQQMIERLCKYNFSGILIHRELFKTMDKAAAFEAQLAKTLGTPLKESNDREFAFFPISAFCNDNHISRINLRAERVRLLLDDNLEEGIDFTKRGYPGFVASTSGLSFHERGWRWTDGPVAKILLRPALPKRFRLEIAANAFQQNLGAPVKVRAGQVERSFVITQNNGEAHSIEFATDGAVHSIEIFPPKPTSPNDLDSRSGDTRKLGLALFSLRIEAEP